MARKTKRQRAQEIWDRYREAQLRGHAEYQKKARENEDFYLGGGRQWDDEAKATLDAEGKPWLEPNLVFSIINTIHGYQTQSRMDIAYKPRELTDEEIAEVLSKLAMFVLDSNQYQWLESDTFADGIIQGRGYLDIRMDFDENFYGDIKICVKDPLDIIPDPDAKSYDTDEWNDVIETRWMTLDEIEETYGRKIRLEVARYQPEEQDWGADELGADRRKFAETGTDVRPWVMDEMGTRRVRVIERQYRKLHLREYFVGPTGDIEPVPDDLSEKDKKAMAAEKEADIIKKLDRRIRWAVCTHDVMIHDEWSPYEHFTIVPYFPYFRRGTTIGMVDNLTSTQTMLNKVFSQMLHVVNTTANSGWMVEEDSLTNMEAEDLEEVGSQSGLILEYKRGREKPEKIQPNQIPSGLDRLAQEASGLIKTISGVSDVFQGQKGPEVTGAAIQSRVAQNAVQLAVPIDNLFRTRNMVAKIILSMVQKFYTEERVVIITEYDGNGNPQNVELGINMEDADDEGNLLDIINDVTVGKYDVVVADVPDTINYQDAQFNQVIELKKFGVEIPDDEIVRYSSLSRKNELAKRLSGENPELQRAQQEAMTLENAKLKAEIAKVKSEAEARHADSLSKLKDVAELLLQDPAIAAVMDRLVIENEAKAAEKEENALGEVDEPMQPMV